MRCIPSQLSPSRSAPCARAVSLGVVSLGVVALGLLQMQDGTRQLRLVSLIRPTSHTASCISHCTRDGRPSNRRMSDRFLGVQAVIPVADRGKDRRLDRGPVVHYLAVAEVQHPVAECSEPRVPDPIPFECRRV